MPPVLSRALLTPGPLPPLSHFGVTLLRHVVGTGLRYGLFQLGLPMPEAPPVRMVRLRLYLDAGKLESLLAERPGGSEVAAALLDPGGAGGLPPAARSVSAAAAFHRVRLRFTRLAASGRPPAVAPGADPSQLWQKFSADLSRLMPLTNDALLADLLASLDRRRRRARGEDVPPALSRAAGKLLSGRRVDLARFGLPDPLAPSWAESPALADAARRALGSQALPPSDRLRGRFREAYRSILSRLAPLYRALAAGAAERGLLADPEDAFFIPFDLAGDLAGSHKPGWLEGAVRNNRAEHDNLRGAAEPLDLLTVEQEMTATSGEREEWNWGAVLPLP